MTTVNCDNLKERKTEANTVRQTTVVDEEIYLCLKIKISIVLRTDKGKKTGH